MRPENFALAPRRLWPRYTHRAICAHDIFEVAGVFGLMAGMDGDLAGGVPTPFTDAAVVLGAATVSVSAAVELAAPQSWSSVSSALGASPAGAASLDSPLPHAASGVAAACAGAGESRPLTPCAPV